MVEQGSSGEGGRKGEAQTGAGAKSAAPQIPAGQIPAGQKPAGQKPAGQKSAGKRADPPPRNPFIALVAVIVGIVLLYWLSTLFVDWNKTQACVSVGGHNCSPRIPLDD